MELLKMQKDFIGQTVKENGLKSFTIYAELAVSKGENFGSVVTRVVAKNDKDELNLIMKSSEHNFSRMLFNREIFFYQNIIKEFILFQNNFNIPHTFSGIPKYYSASNGKLQMLLIEDLNVKNYKMSDRKETMNGAHIEIVIKEYSKFHCLSLAMKEKHPDNFNNLTKDLKDVFSYESSPEEIKAFKKHILVDSLSVFEEDSNETNYLKKIIDEIDAEEYSEKSEDDIVVIHGDCWCNNFLFKYGDENTYQPLEVSVIDWQLTRLGSPLIDITYFLFSNSSEETLKDFRNFLKIYHNVIYQNLVGFTCNPEKVFPYSLLVEHWNRNCKLGFLFSVFAMKFNLLNAKDINEEEKCHEKEITEIFNVKVKNIDEYKKRLRILVKFMIQNEVL